MAKFIKGHSGNPNGRGKGVTNKSTEIARVAIAKFVDNNSERLQGWLDEIAADDPYKAFNCVKDLMEYHLPKLARSEHTGADGGAIDTKTEITITHVKADNGKD
jgi:hypothetical protein